MLTYSAVGMEQMTPVAELGYREPIFRHIYASKFSELDVVRILDVATGHDFLFHISILSKPHSHMPH